MGPTGVRALVAKLEEGVDFFVSACRFLPHAEMTVTRRDRYQAAEWATVPVGWTCRPASRAAGPHRGRSRRDSRRDTAGLPAPPRRPDPFAAVHASALPALLRRAGSSGSG